MTIKAGDLVLCVRGCDRCDCQAIGTVFRVIDVGPIALMGCSQYRDGLDLFSVAYGCEDGSVFPIEWLKKIDPPAVSVERTEEMVI